MSEELIRMIEIGVAGVVLTIATFYLGMFRAELLGVVFSLTTLAAQSLVACLEQLGGAPISGSSDPHS
jgi:hypothetical protein